MAFDAARVKAIFFDVDGTLADTDDEYIRRVARRLGLLRRLFPRGDPTTFLRWGVMTVESPMNTLMWLPDWLGIDDELVALANWLDDRRRRPLQGRFAIMPGVMALLPRLAERYPLAVVTARSERQTRAFLEQFNLGAHFQRVASAQTAPRTKPYPDPVVWAAREFNLPPAHCLMIGDTTFDIRAGKQAGAQAVGVLCGFGQRRELERSGADLILERTEQLAEVLLG